MTKAMYVTIGSGRLKQKIRLKKSPKGRLYIGKAVFQNELLAESRANALKSSGVKAWVEGRTVYNR